jgi:hypothetical protein
MPDNSFQPFLPFELILYTIDFVAPSPPYPIALPPSHPTTRTLSSLLRTSRAIYPAARRLLYTYSLYISTPTALCTLHLTLSNPKNTTLLTHITSLYLSPFATSLDEDVPTTQTLSSLLHQLAPTLRRLIIDIPLRSLYPDDDHTRLRPSLRDAFSALTSLELFCSVQDELYLDTVLYPLSLNQVPVWSLWPKLKTLALYNQDVRMDKFWAGLGKLKYLEAVVLTRSDGLEDLDFRREWERHCGGNKNARDANFVFVNIQAHHRLRGGLVYSEEKDKVGVWEVNVPTSYYGDDDAIELCQNWVRRKTLSGENVRDWMREG